MSGWTRNGAAGPHGMGNDPVTAVQADIDRGVSVHDAVFRRQRERFGEAFVTEYLSEMATHMAVHVVRAFEAHDRKQYERCARHFGEVYTFLFPVTLTRAHAAGAGYALALKQHDVVEDGVDTVATGEPVTTDYVVADTGVPQRAREVLDHPYWNAVLFGFELVVDALDLPYRYAEEQTEFFRYHTAAHEARVAPAIHRDLGRTAMQHARHAQQIKFGRFVDDEETLATIADVYLAAIQSHDAHTPREQAANISRMLYIYDRVLADTVDADRLDERVPGLEDTPPL